MRFVPWFVNTLSSIVYMLSFQNAAEQIHVTRHKTHTDIHTPHTHTRTHIHTHIRSHAPNREPFLTSLTVPASLQQPTEHIPEENAVSNSKETGSGGDSGLSLFAVGVAVGALATMLVKKRSE